MKSHYFNRNRDLKIAEGKTRENTYDRSSSHHSQMTYGVGAKRKDIWQKTFLIEKDDLIEDKEGRRLEGKKGWTATGTKNQPNYQKKTNKETFRATPVTKKVTWDPKSVKDTRSWGRTQMCQDSGNTKKPTRKETKSEKGKEK